MTRTAGGEKLFWGTANGGTKLTMTAYAESDLGATNPIFRVNITNAGVLTVELYQPMAHATGNAKNNLSFLLILHAVNSAGMTNQTLTIYIDDDMPNVTLSGATQSLTVDETNLASDDLQSFAGLFTKAHGADGAGTFTYTLGIKAAGVDSGLVDMATGGSRPATP